MPYSREELNKLSGNLDKQRYNQISQDLLNKALAGADISLAEEQFVCGILRILQTPENNKAFDISELSCCNNFRFRTTYMLYFKDINGHKKIFDVKGEIPLHQKLKDVDYLHQEYISWMELIKNKQNGSELINFVAKESTDQLKKLRKYCKDNLIGSRYHDALKKTLVLHSKYIYLIVKEFYQEVDYSEIILAINGKKVLINPYAYVHILFRHYAGSIKQHQHKSYHYNELINFKDIPHVLSEIISMYAEHFKSEFNGSHIYLEIDNEPYAIWFKPITRFEKNSGEQSYLRAETFYPIEVEREKKKIAQLNLHKTGSRYDFYI